MGTRPAISSSAKAKGEVPVEAPASRGRERHHVAPLGNESERHHEAPSPRDHRTPYQQGEREVP